MRRRRGCTTVVVITFTAVTLSRWYITRKAAKIHPKKQEKKKSGIGQRSTQNQFSISYCVRTSFHQFILSKPVFNIYTASDQVFNIILRLNQFSILCCVRTSFQYYIASEPIFNNILRRNQFFNIILRRNHFQYYTASEPVFNIKLRQNQFSILY